MQRLNECSCGCGGVGQCMSDKLQEKEPNNYMFFGDLKTIKRSVDAMLQMDPQKIDALLTNGHDWAADHIATSKDDIEEVAGFLMNEMEDHGEKTMRVAGLPFVHTFESYSRHFQLDDENSDEMLSDKLMTALRSEDWDLVKSVSMALRYRNRY
jgi:hypothetical protein